jgi:hypothetical protein
MTSRPCITGACPSSRAWVVPGSLAEIYADRVDRPQVARLVRRGCPPRLALRIVG